jgi:hypothetical protein
VGFKPNEDGERYRIYQAAHFPKSVARDIGESRYIVASMPRTNILHPLTTAQGRRIWLRAQRLDTSEPFGEGPQATAAAVEHLG